MLTPSLEMARDVGSRCLSLIRSPHPWATAIKMTHHEDDPSYACHSTPLQRQDKTVGLTHGGQMPSGVAGGVMGRH